MPLSARSLAIPHPLLAGSLGVLIGLFVLAGLDVGGQAALWENAHWTLSSLIALGMVTGAWRARAGTGRSTDVLAVLGLGLYALGQMVWNVQFAAGLYLIPAPSDLFYLGAALPLAATGIVATRRALPRGEALALAIDGLIVVLSVATAVLFVYAPIASGSTPGLGTVLLAYPIAYIGLGGFVLLTAAAVRRLGDWRCGPLPVAIGLMLIGVNWVVWIHEAIVAFPAAGSVINMVSSVAIVMVAHGYRTWEREGEANRTATALTGAARAALPVGAAVSAAAILIVHEGVGHEGIDAVATTAWAVIGLALARQTMLLLDRTRSVGRSLASRSQRSGSESSASSPSEPWPARLRARRAIVGSSTSSDAWASA